MLDLRLQKERHTVRSAQFLRVVQLYQIFAYRRKDITCVARSFFLSLSYVRSSLIEQGTHRVQRFISSGDLCPVLFLIEQGTHSVQRFISSGGLCPVFAYRTRQKPCLTLYFLRWILSDFCFQNKAHTVCSALFPRVTYVRFLLIEQDRHRVQRFISSNGLCPIFACRTRHTPYVAIYFLGWIMSDFWLQNKAHTVCSSLFPRVTYVRFLLIEQGTHRVQRFISSNGLCPIFACRTRHTPYVAIYFLAWIMFNFRLQNKANTVCSSLFPWVTYVRVLLIEQLTHHVQLFISWGAFCPIFAYRTRNTPCLALYFLGWIMSDFCLQNKANTVWSALFPRVDYVRILLME